MSKPQIVLVTLETRSFSFKSAGATQAEAEAGLKAAWKKHREQAQANGAGSMPAATIKALDDEFGLHYLTMTLGVGYRDGEPVPREAEAG